MGITDLVLEYLEDSALCEAALKCLMSIIPLLDIKSDVLAYLVEQLTKHLSADKDGEQ